MTPGEFEEQVELTIQDGVAALNKVIDAEIFKRIREQAEGVDDDAEIDALIEARNQVLLEAEAIGEAHAKLCWIRMGVANRHIERLVSGSMRPMRGVRREIERCLRDAREWLLTIERPAVVEK